MPSRPDRLVVVVGTGTEVGKTWWTCAVARRLRADGVRVAARKPVQSFAPDEPPTARDASLLAAATGEEPHDVCPPNRSYGVAMAPPMAAAALGLPPFRIANLASELRWPGGVVDVGFVETAGGLRSPLASDGDNLALLESLDPTLVVVVADAGLGTINLVRLTAGALVSRPVVVVLNRYDAANDLHRRNAAWLTDIDGLDVLVGVEALADRLRGSSTPLA